MGWDHLSSSLQTWFADAWARGLLGAAEDLAWSVTVLEHPRLTVSPALRIVLDVINTGAGTIDGDLSFSDLGLQSMSCEIRLLLEHGSRLEEAAARYGDPRRPP